MVHWPKRELHTEARSIWAQSCSFSPWKLQFLNIQCFWDWSRGKIGCFGMSWGQSTATGQLVSSLPCKLPCFHLAHSFNQLPSPPLCSVGYHIIDFLQMHICRVTGLFSMKSRRGHWKEVSLVTLPLCGTRAIKEWNTSKMQIHFLCKSLESCAKNMTKTMCCYAKCKLNSKF